MLAYRYDVLKIAQEYFVCLYGENNYPLGATKISKIKYDLFEENKFAFDIWFKKQMKEDFAYLTF